MLKNWRIAIQKDLWQLLKGDLSLLHPAGPKNWNSLKSLKQSTLWKKKHDPVCFRWKIIGLKKGAPLSHSCNRHLGNAFLSTVTFSTTVTFHLQLELNWQKIIGKWIVTKVWIGPSGQNYNSIAKIKCIQNLFRLDSEARRCIVGIERRTRPMTTWWKPKFCKWENLPGIFLTVTIMRAHSKFFCCWWQCLWLSPQAMSTCIQCKPFWIHS